VGKHQSRQLPPSWGQSHRYLIAFISILVLAFAALALVAVLFPS